MKVQSGEARSYTLLTMNCIACQREVERVYLAEGHSAKGGYNAICHKCWDDFRMRPATSQRDDA